MENGMEILKDEMIYRLPAGIIRFYIGEKIRQNNAGRILPRITFKSKRRPLDRRL